jgi:hypothetical protein
MTRRSLALFLTMCACLSCGGESTAPAEPIAARLEMHPPLKGNSIAMGNSIQVTFKLFDTENREMQIPPGLTFISRNPAVISVESDHRIQTRSPGPQVWLVASLSHQGRTIADSAAMSVTCTLELRISIRPDSVALNVGESFTPSAELSTCGGHVRVNDTITYSAFYATNSTVTGVISVDSLTGATTALKPGSAWTVVRSANHGQLGAIPVTVR